MASSSNSSNFEGNVYSVVHKLTSYVRQVAGLARTRLVLVLLTLFSFDTFAPLTIEQSQGLLHRFVSFGFVSFGFVSFHKLTKATVGYETKRNETKVYRHIVNQASSQIVGLDYVLLKCGAKYSTTFTNISPVFAIFPCRRTEINLELNMSNKTLATLSY